MPNQDRSRGDALKQAGGYALREISARPGRLLSTLQGLGYGSAANRHGAPVGPPDVNSLKRALGSDLDLLRKVAEETGQGERELAETVGRQLGVVAVFAELDGGRLEENVSAAENLIRSGRVHLFTR